MNRSSSDARFAETGWRSVRAWEHEDPEEAAGRVEKAIKDPEVGGSTGRCDRSTQDASRLNGRAKADVGLSRCR